MEKLPTVTLDTTLADLYKIGQNGTKWPSIALVPCGWSSGTDLGEGRPRNKRYLFQENITVSKTESECASFSPEKIREIQAKFFSLVSQRDSFGAGNMSTIFFSWDANEHQPSRTETEAWQTFTYLAEHQRPQPLFCSGPDDLKDLMAQNHIDTLALKVPIDIAEKLPNFSDFANWTYLNSKAAIAESGLPTPKTILLEPTLCEVESKDCCETCASHPYTTEILETCTGKRLPWLKEEVQKFVSAFDAHEVPFVVKSQQSGGGGGTWIIKTEEEKKEFLDQGRSIIFAKLLGSFTALNQDLRPATLGLMDFVDNEVHNWGLTFFITRTGTPIFLSATEQRLLNGKFWYGSAVNYLEQDKLQVKFQSLMDKVTDFLFHRQKPGSRYFGPIGADILEVAPTNGRINPSDDDYLIVDLNARIPGSLTLGLLKSHFATSRTDPSDPPLPFAVNQFLEISVDRSEFIANFKHEFYDTRAIVITAWYYDDQAHKSHVALVLGGRTEEELTELQSRVSQFSREFRLA